MAKYNIYVGTRLVAQVIDTKSLGAVAVQNRVSAVRQPDEPVVPIINLDREPKSPTPAWPDLD